MPFETSQRAKKHINLIVEKSNAFFWGDCRMWRVFRTIPSGWMTEAERWDEKPSFGLTNSLIDRLQSYAFGRGKTHCGLLCKSSTDSFRADTSTSANHRQANKKQLLLKPHIHMAAMLHRRVMKHIARNRDTFDWGVSQLACFDVLTKHWVSFTFRVNFLPTVP